MFFYNPLQMFYNTENSRTRNDHTKMGNLDDKHKPPPSTPRRKDVLVVTELETNPDIFFLSFFSICTDDYFINRIAPWVSIFCSSIFVLQKSIRHPVYLPDEFIVRFLN